MPRLTSRSAEPAPGSSHAPVIGYLTANPSQGTCNIAPSLLRCGLDRITAGETVTIAVTGRAREVGEHTNVATVMGSGGRETNPADNVDDAVTVVPKPLPAPEPVMCLVVSASPKTIRADGRPDRIRVKVVAGKAPVKRARVIVFGAGIRGSAKSNASGLAFLTVNPRKAGLLTVTVLDARREVCGVKRIGVVGVWLAPLTG